MIFPLASGVPAVGRTLTFCQVKEFITLLLVAAVIVIVNVVVVIVTAIVEPLARSLILRLSFPFPAVRVTKTVGDVPPVSKTNPDGTFSIIVPVPMSAVAPSEIIGPVKEVWEPPVVSAEIAEPPVADVTVTVAKTSEDIPKRQINTTKNRIQNLFTIFFIITKRSACLCTPFVYITQKNYFLLFINILTFSTTSLIGCWVFTK